MRPTPPVPVRETPPPAATLSPIVAAEPLEGTLDGKHARAVFWTPAKGPRVRVTMEGPKLAVSYHGARYGDVNAFWPHGCGTVGLIRWAVSPAGKLTLTCAWHDSQSYDFITLRWNGDEAEVELDDTGIVPSR